MRKKGFIFAVFMATYSCGYAATTTNLYIRYQSIIEDRSLVQSERATKTQALLASLSRSEFLDFVRDAIKTEPRYADEKSEHSIDMNFFATIYANELGEKETLQETVRQLSDTTLPSTWKMALLDAIKLNRRQSMTESEIVEVISVLSKAGQSKQNSDMFRSFCLGKFGSVIHMQQKLITQKAPDLKDALEKQDKGALPKRDDANVKQAAKLIDDIRDYKVVLQKTADEVKDEKIKANLKKRLAMWDTASVMPAK